MTNDTTNYVLNEQMLVKKHQIVRFIDFINCSKGGFEDFAVLVKLIMEKSERHTTAYTLAAITLDKINMWSDVCLEERNFLKEFSPELAKEFEEELTQ